MNSRVLILKSGDNGFEEFFSNMISSRGYCVAEPYRVSVNNMNSLQKKLFFTKYSLLYSFFMGDWKTDILSYDYIVIFDSALTWQLVQYIKGVNKSCKIIIWLWNVDPIDSNLYKDCTICTFDESFAEEHGYTFARQFYFDDVYNRESPVSQGVFYIGFDKDRFEKLEQIAAILDDYGIVYKFLLRKNDDRLYPNNCKVELISEDMNYDEVVKESMGYSCLLELNPRDQMGLTLRSLESLFGNKKLITDNINIDKYDFYNPNNIFIFGKDNNDSLPAFMSSDIVPVDDDLLTRYSFENWIDQITEEKYD